MTVRRQLEAMKDRVILTTFYSYLKPEKDKLYI